LRTRQYAGIGTQYCGQTKDCGEHVYEIARQGAEDGFHSTADTRPSGCVQDGNRSRTGNDLKRFHETFGLTFFKIKRIVIYCNFQPVHRLVELPEDICFNARFGGMNLVNPAHTVLDILRGNEGTFFVVKDIA
jgi:hypothetical protein